MNDQLWGWILSIVGLTGLFLAGQKIWWSWYLSIAGQVLWFAYAIVTEQYGFFVAAFGYTFVFTKNAIKWTKEHFDENEGWDFNEYSFAIETYSPNEIRAINNFPEREYCSGDLEKGINPRCMLPNPHMEHEPHSWEKPRLSSETFCGGGPASSGDRIDVYNLNPRCSTMIVPHAPHHVSNDNGK